MVVNVVENFSMCFQMTVTCAFVDNSSVERVEEASSHYFETGSSYNEVLTTTHSGSLIWLELQQMPKLKHSQPDALPTATATRIIISNNFRDELGFHRY